MRVVLDKALRTTLVIAGCAFVVVGVVGIFLPLLPTTPFLLLAAFCFDKGSPKFHAWILNHKVLGPPILDWKRGQVIRPRNKAMACALILVTSYFVLAKPAIPVIGKVVYGLTMLGVVSFILTRKSR